MKKIICVLLCSVAGMAVVSCEVDSLSENTLENKDFKVAVENVSSNLNDSIPSNNSPGIGDDEGPGDGLFPIKPPKK